MSRKECRDIYGLINTEHVQHTTKSLRDSPLRGAGELIKLNPLGTEQGYIGTVIDLD